MSTQRIAKGVAATLTLNVYSETDALTSIGSSVAVSVANSAGTVVSSGTATGTTSPYTYSLPAQATLGPLVATWTSSGITWTTEHEIVAARYAPLAAIRASHDELASDGDYSDAQVLEKRDSVEIELEDIAGLSFVRRRARLTLDGSGTRTLELPVRYIRRIVSATIGGTALSAGDIALIVLDDDDPPRSCTGVLVRDGSYWSAGRRNVVLDVEHGFDSPPSDVLSAFHRLMYHRLHTRNTEVLDRAVSFGAGGGTYQLAQATATSTGIDEIDAVLSRYSRKGREGKTVPASRPLRLSVQRAGALFHS